jgi:hypothetical protein
MGRRRRKRVTSTESKKERQQQPQPLQPQKQPTQPQQQDMAAAGGAEGGVGYGVVHEAVPGSVPPPAHEGQSILYMVLDERGYWYGGETQVRECINQSDNQRYTCSIEAQSADPSHIRFWRVTQT